MLQVQALRPATFLPRRIDDRRQSDCETRACRPATRRQPEDLLQPTRQRSPRAAAVDHPCALPLRQRTARRLKGWPACDASRVLARSFSAEPQRCSRRGQAQPPSSLTPGRAGSCDAQSDTSVACRSYAPRRRSSRCQTDRQTETESTSGGADVLLCERCFAWGVRVQPRIQIRPRSAVCSRRDRKLSSVWRLESE